MDYCNCTVLASALRTVTDKLQRVLNAAARVITGTSKFDRGLGQILREQCQKDVTMPHKYFKQHTSNTK